MMILLSELAIKSEGIRFRLLWTIELTTKLLSFLIISFLTENLTFRAQIPLTGPVFSAGAMGQIPITLKNDRQDESGRTHSCYELTTSI